MKEIPEVVSTQDEMKAKKKSTFKKKKKKENLFSNN